MKKNILLLLISLVSTVSLAQTHTIHGDTNGGRFMNVTPIPLGYYFNDVYIQRVYVKITSITPIADTLPGQVSFDWSLQYPQIIDSITMEWKTAIFGHQDLTFRTNLTGGQTAQILFNYVADSVIQNGSPLNIQLTN